MLRSCDVRVICAATVALLLATGCSSRVEKICKKMAILMGSSAASEKKIRRCIKRAKRAQQAMPERFECRARCIESSIDRTAFNACNDKCDPAAAARRAAIRAARAAAANRSSGGKHTALALPREVRRKWFTECNAKCQHFIKESGTPQERVEGTKKAGLCTKDCIKLNITTYMSNLKKKK
ncbi:MAG: hypothetical protein KC503_33400 [Myxococcales bacterium]|nr:hypothetical protein [Myxococcales bacterium]